MIKWQWREISFHRLGSGTDGRVTAHQQAAKEAKRKDHSDGRHMVLEYGAGWCLGGLLDTGTSQTTTVSTRSSGKIVFR